MNKSELDIENDLQAIVKTIKNVLLTKPFYGNINISFQASSFCGIKITDTMTAEDVRRCAIEAKTK